MKYVINEDGQFAYLQLYNQIKNDVVNGAYSYGAKLPSKRILSEETGISIITIEHAYALLVEEGYIASKERSGFYVIYKQDDFNNYNQDSAQPIRAFQEDVKDYSGHFPFSVISKATRKVLLDYGDKLLIKSHNQGLNLFRQTICNYLSRTVGISACPEQIVIGAGSEYLYSLVLQLVGKDRIFAIENPSYNKISQVYKANGIQFELLQMTSEGIKTECLQKSKATVLHTTPYNSFPSLVTATASKRQEYLQWAKQRGGFIIEDNYDSELTISKKHQETLFSLSTNQDVIYINTFSKTISSAVRVGYMVLPKRLVEQFQRNLGFYSCTVPVFEQYLLNELISSGEFERHVNRVRRNKRKQN